MPTKAPSRREQSPAELLNQLTLGYNGYTSPDLTNPKMWAAATNVFTGPFGFIQRARFANIVPTLAAPLASMKFYAIPGVGAYLLADCGVGSPPMVSYDTGNNYAATVRPNPYAYAGSQLFGPWSREVLENIVYEMNGQVKLTGRGANAATIEGFGIDAPDASPAVVIASGTSVNITSITRLNGVVTATVASAFGSGAGNGTMLNVAGVTDSSFNGTFTLTTGGGTTTLVWSQFGQNVTSSGGTVNNTMTKAIGRSYSWAWENVNKSHVGAPSPATQYIQYTAQNGTVQLVETGTVSCTTNNVTGTGTFFSQAWVGKHLWAVGFGDAGIILGVFSNTSLNLAGLASRVFTNAQFIVFDPACTHTRLYQTADGQATYFRTQRNAFVPSATTLAAAGLQFFDNGNSEPPNFPYTTETAQANNVPPPVGAFLNEYQGRLIVYGVSGSPQTFYYSNQESTQIGLQQESFAPLNQVTLPIANGKINGMIEFPGSMVIWSDKQDMFRLTGLLTDNTVTGVAANTAAAQQGAQIARLPYNLGCASPFATEITPLGGIWLTSNAEVWLFTDRYAPRNIGRPVQDILNSVSPANLSLVRMKYYHNNTRNWLVIAVAANQAAFNNTVLVLDLDQLASNGSPSFFTFDMATNSPAWYVFQPGVYQGGVWYPRCDSVEVVYENTGLVRLLGGVGFPTSPVNYPIQDLDFQGGVGTESMVPDGSITFHAWGNDSPFAIKRPTWIRFNTNRDPSVLSNETSVGISSVSRSGSVVTVTTSAAHGLGTQAVVFVSGVTDSSFNGAFQVASTPSNTTFTYTQPGPNASSSGGLVASGWSFGALGIDDDFYTFQAPLVLQLIPGVNDSSTLCGNPDFVGGLAFRHSPELYRIGGVNFTAGRRLKFQVNFPVGTGVNYQFRQVQLGFGVEPPN